MKRSSFGQHVGAWGLVAVFGAGLLVLPAPQATADLITPQPVSYANDPTYLQLAAVVIFYTKKVKYLSQCKTGLGGEIGQAVKFKKLAWPVVYAAYLKRPKEYAKTLFKDYLFAWCGVNDYPSWLFRTDYVEGGTLKEAAEKKPQLRKLIEYITEQKGKWNSVTGTLLPAAEIELSNARDELDKYTSNQTDPNDQPVSKTSP